MFVRSLGGYRCWPLAGWWSPGESSTSLQRCRAPALSRCLGWLDGQVQCGEAFSGPACGGCASGYYGDGDLCEPCGDDRDMWSAVLRPVLMVVGAGGVLFALLVLATFVVIRSSRKFQNGAPANTPR